MATVESFLNATKVLVGAEDLCERLILLDGVSEVELEDGEYGNLLRFLVTTLHSDAYDNAVKIIQSSLNSKYPRISVGRIMNQTPSSS